LRLRAGLGRLSARMAGQRRRRPEESAKAPRVVAKVSAGRGRPRINRPLPFEDLHFDGDRVELLRRRRQWSQAELAEKAGVHPATISQVEVNGTAIKVPTAVSIADALECSLDYLTRRTNDPELRR
jgi:DNA-binding XRE family transcriptional regulator